MRPDAVNTVSGVRGIDLPDRCSSGTGRVSGAGRAQARGVIRHMLFAAAPTPTPTPAPTPLAPDGYELVIGAVAFLIVFAVLARVLIPRINGILEERTKAIDGGLKQAEDAQAEAARVLEEYQ